MSVSEVGKTYTFKSLANDDVFIGNAADADFHPTLTLNRWNAEAWLKLAYDDSQIAETQKTVALQSNKVVWDTPLFAFRFYPLAQAIVCEDGGLEFEIILKSKPPQNSFSFSIQTRNLTFYYQPPLSQELNPVDCVELSETYARLKNGIETHRPENVVGSYAVYHTTKANGAYETGKAFHIYRPKLTDADGKTALADLNIDVANGTLVITLPAAFLDTATYPVVVDPTFGYTSIGGSYTQLGSNDKLGCQYQAPEAGTLTDISVYFYTNSGGSFYAAVYNDSGNTPNALLESKQRTGIPAEQTNWFTWTGFNTAISASTWYWLTINSPIYIEVHYDTASTYRSRLDTDDTPPPDDPFGAGTDYTNRRHSIYATYTAAGGTLKTVTDSLGLYDSMLRHKGLLPVSDAVGLAEAVLRHRALSISDSLGVSDVVKSDKTLSITDIIAVSEVVRALKTLVITDQIDLADLLDVIKEGILKSVADAIGLADSALLNKILNVGESVVLVDAVSTPSRFLKALDAVGLADGALVSKVLLVTESIYLVEIVEVGVAGAKKTRIFLLLGDLAVQLTGD
jgi:hypothetical protein